MNQFCDMKGVKREFSVARTPQQNGVAEMKNKTLIEAARTMLVDYKLLTTFWAKVVNTSCYVLNRVLVIKPHNKTPYELIPRIPLLIDFMKPFRFTILNTKDHLGKFDGKADEGFFVGYYMVSKAMRVFNKRTMIVKDTLNIRFLENAPNVKGNRADWLFDIDSLTISMNYEPVVTGKQTNNIAGTKDNIVVGQAEKKKEPKQEYILVPICTNDPLISQSPKDSAVDTGKKATKVDKSQVSDNGGQDDQVTRSEFEGILQQEKQTEHINSTNCFSIVSSPVSTTRPSFANTASPSPINDAGTPSCTNAFEEHPFERFSRLKNAFSLPHVPIMTPLNDTRIFGNAYDDAAMEDEVDMNNVVSFYTIPDAPLTKLIKDHPKDQVIGSIETPVQIRQMTRINKEHVKWAIGTKWVFRNKKDERGIVVKNKARLVSQGYTQEKGIDYDEVFAPVAKIEAIRLFLDYASFKDFVVYQMDVKSAFLYGKIEEEVYVCQPPVFEDLDFPDKVYKVEKALYGLHQAPRACAIFLAVASLFFLQWHLSSLTVGSCSASGNSYN
nr:putative ribonuclease H-like domain-containing protein [Tanacetum cinerariifolium]